MKNQGKVIFSLFAIFLTIHTNSVSAEAAPAFRAEQSSTATVLSPAQPLPAFSLVDTSGKRFTSASLKDHWTLLFFGYAQCPVTCPRALAVITEAWRAFSQPNAQFIFITLDPKADNPEALKQFLVNFNPSFIGLTGEENQIKSLAQACRIYSWTDPTLNAAGQKIIDHSATLLLVNPQGDIQALFSPPHQSDVLAKELKVLMKS